MVGITHRWIDKNWDLQEVLGNFEKMSGSTRSVLLAEKLPKLWEPYDVDDLTTDCCAEMNKMGRILDVGKPQDAEGPAIKGLGIQHHGCIAHRMDKLHLLLAKHPLLQPLLNKLKSISTHVHKSSQSQDHMKKCAEMANAEYVSIKAMVDSRWWSLFMMLDSFWANMETLVFQRDSPKNPLVPADVYNLTEADWRDIEVLRELSSAFKEVQLQLEGEKYITVSLVIPALELVRHHLHTMREAYLAAAAPIGVAVMNDVIAAFEQRFGDGSCITEFKEGPSRQPQGYTAAQVMGVCLDPRFVPLTCIPPNQEAAAWTIVRNKLISVINESREAYNPSADDGADGDWLTMAEVSAGSASVVTAEQLADRELTLWRLRKKQLSKDTNPLEEWRRAQAVVPWMAKLARRVLAVAATSASPERLFSTAGNEMTKKRCRLTCHNFGDIVYLHEVWPKTREWAACKRQCGV